jgi:hypothetical protein
MDVCGLVSRTNRRQNPFHRSLDPLGMMVKNGGLPQARYNDYSTIH